MSPAPLDGNVTAGDLADIFAFDATTAVTTCATCRATHPIATLHAYLRAPGIVLRCKSCDAVQIRLVRSPLRAWLDLRGIDMLAMPVTVASHSMDGAAASRIDEATR
jgi:Family of unknown function (DUF6510)